MAEDQTEALDLAAKQLDLELEMRDVLKRMGDAGMDYRVYNRAAELAHRKEIEDRYLEYANKLTSARDLVCFERSHAYDRDVRQRDEWSRLFASVLGGIFAADSAVKGDAARMRAGEVTRAALGEEPPRP